MAQASVHQRGAVGDPRDLTVLDLGCGAGRRSVWLAASGASVTAVDFSEGMLAQARSKPGAATVRFLTHDLQQSLPFQAGAFDLVVSGLVLEPLRDLDLFFGEAHRVLRPGGRAVVSAIRAGFALAAIAEGAPDAEFAQWFSRAAKYVGWPLLIVLSMLANGQNVQPGGAANRSRPVGSEASRTAAAAGSGG